MPNKQTILLAALAAAVLFAACDLSPVPPATPTLEQVATASPTQPPTLTPAPSLTATPVPQIEQPATAVPGTPTDTPTVTPTPNPYATWIIQPSDTLYYIIQQPPFNYKSDSWNRVINEVLQLNPFMRSADRLPGPGSSILIPLPTPTPSPENYQLTMTAQPNLPQVSLPGNAQIIQVKIEEGDVIVGIAEQNSTTLAIIATLNPQLQFYGCDFSNPSGGPDCNVTLKLGEMVNVPALTPTPTLSPTISGSETATLTPTYGAPTLFFPPQDASVGGRTFQLEWIGVGVLRDQEVYLVEIQDETAGTQRVDVSTSTSYDLPAELVPTDGQAHTIHWRVSVAAPNAQGQYRYIGAQGTWRTFRWQSR